MPSRRRSAKEWSRLIEEWGASGKSVTDFAQPLGINPRTLGWWRWKLAQTAPSPNEARTTDFVELVVPRPQPPDLAIEIGALTIRVPHGFDAGELRRLLAVVC